VTGNKAARVTIIILILSGFLYSGHAQSLNYAEVFGSDWQKALTFLDENNTWIKPALDRFDIPFNELIAVVFPELVRYSALRDKMEISMLKTLYRNLGDDYADFSIGVFQIKPSFAEEILERVFSATDKELRSLFRKKTSFPNKRLFRASIISDLENPETELNYLIAFYSICERQFGKELNDAESRIKLFATAYNTGKLKNAKDIEAMSDKKFFNTGLFKTENYSYSDVSLYWYSQYCKAEK
jgi:hypothetical protein